MNSAAAAEQVLVIPAERLRVAGMFTGFRPFDAAFRDAILNPADFSFRTRDAVENDPNYKQIIPYCVLRAGSLVFQYVRGNAGSESRLRAKRSIGIGGHISREDDRGQGDPYRLGMMRELTEEVEISCNYNEKCAGFIFDPSTPVGEVHLGVVHVLELDRPEVRPREKGIADGRFVSTAELRIQLEQFETWSQFVIRELDG